MGVQHAVGVGSGTDAIELALRACGVGLGDLVLTVSHTAVATVAAIERCGATPALVDIDPVTFTMAPQALDSAAARTRGASRAVVPVHLYGQPADMAAIMEIAKRYDLFVIEDCSQAHGASIGETHVGAFGHLSAFSFYPTKNLGALGDAGMVLTNDNDLATKAMSIHQYGWRRRNISDVPGINSRMDEIQAAILNVKLQALDTDNRRRQAIARQYDLALDLSGLHLPEARPGVTHVYHQYVVRSSDRDALRQYLHEHGVGTLIHYPEPVHLQPAYIERLPYAGSLVNTEAAARDVLSLPIFPQLSDDDVRVVTDRLMDWANGRSSTRPARRAG